MVEEKAQALVEILRDAAPNISPAIIPSSSCTVKSLWDICSSPSQEQALERFAGKCEHRLALRTDVNVSSRKIRVRLQACDAVDETLLSLEKTLRLLVVGSTDELSVLKSRFCSSNGHTDGENDDGRAFEQCYNTAASLKVLLENLSGLAVEFEGKPLPLDPSEDLGALLKKAKVVKKKALAAQKNEAGAADGRRGPASGSDDDDSDADAGDDRETQRSSKKKKKRKRGKGG